MKLALLILLSAARAFGAEEPLRVGVLGDGGLSEAAARGAARAADEINRAGGVGGRELRLFRMPPSKDPWMDGAASLARFAYSNGLDAMIGPDGRELSHLAAQIATKKRIPLISLSAGDALTRVMDPWIFRGVPDDRVQAAAVLEWAAPRPAERVLLVVPAGRDGPERLSALKRACSSAGVPVAAVLRYEPAGKRDGSPGARPLPGAGLVLVWLDREPALSFLRERRRELRGRRLFGSLRLDAAAARRLLPRGTRLALPVLGGEELGEDLGYDMIRALAEAAGRRGSSAEGIRDGLLDGVSLRGRSGKFRFDGYGNREGEVPVSGG